MDLRPFVRFMHRMRYRISIQVGDFFTGQLPGDADVMLLANVTHIFSPQRDRQLQYRD